MAQEKTIAFELRNLNILIKRYVSKRGPHEGHAESKGITHMHMMILGYLHSLRGQDVYQKDLEKEFFIRGSTVTNMLKRMEAQGLITRLSVEGDARLKKIVLTEKALELFHGFDKKLGGLERIIRDGLTDEEIEAFFSIIGKIKKNLED